MTGYRYTLHIIYEYYIRIQYYNMYMYTLLLIILILLLL